MSEKGERRIGPADRDPSSPSVRPETDSHPTGPLRKSDSNPTGPLRKGESNPTGPLRKGDSNPTGPLRKGDSNPTGPLAPPPTPGNYALVTGPHPQPELEESDPARALTGPFRVDDIDAENELVSVDQPDPPRPPAFGAAHEDTEFYQEEDETFDALVDGPEHLSEGEEAISDTFRPTPETLALEPLPQLRSRFVGRLEQLSTLRDLFLETRQQNRLCFVTLVGEPGAGKGRLAREFARSVRAAFSNARVLWGEPEPGSQRRYEAVARALDERIGIGRDDTVDDACEKIRQAVREALTSSYQEEIPPLLGHVLDVPFADNPTLEALAATPRQLELRAYIAVRRFLQRDAERGPLLLCFDGMESSTNDTVKLVHYLADGLQNSPVMILATARSTVFRRHPNWGQGDFDAHRIEIGPMPPEECEQLFLDLARLDTAPSGILHVARQRLAGSPRSLQDFVRFLLESGVLVTGEARWKLSAERLAEVSLPRSHEDTLRARLRGLPASEAGLLDKAAAIGEHFWLDASVALVRAASISNSDPDGPSLQEIAAAGEKTRIAVAAALQRLCERGLLFECMNSSIVGEREYRFAYPPIWDLTDEGIDELAKRRYHRLVAQWLEARPEGRDEQRQELVGKHLERAGDRRGASSRYRRAADAARARFGNQRAIRLYQAALECLGDADLVTRLHLWHDLGSVYQHRGDFDAALDAFERMVRLGWVVASRPKAAVAFNKMGRVWRQKGNLNLAVEYLHRSLEMFREAGDDRGVATALDDIGQVQWMLGHYEEALDQSAKALEMRRQAGDKRSIAVSLSNIGNIEKDRGLFDEAHSCYSEALRLRREVEDFYGYVVSLNNLAALAYERGELESARETWETALAEAERIGAPPLQLILLNNLGEVATKANKSQDARQRLEQALALATEIDDQRSYMDVLRNLSLLELLDGSTDRARRYARECLNLARRAHLPEMVGKAQMALAEIHAQTLFDASAPSGASGAEGYFKQAIKVFRDMGNEAELAKALRRLGEYQIEQGHVHVGSQSIAEAVKLFAKLGMPDAAALERVLADLDQTGPSQAG